MNIITNSVVGVKCHCTDTAMRNEVTCCVRINIYIYTLTYTLIPVCTIHLSSPTVASFYFVDLIQVKLMFILHVRISQLVMKVTVNNVTGCTCTYI